MGGMSDWQGIDLKYEKESVLRNCFLTTFFDYRG